VSYEWHRPSGSANELWDLTVYAHAGVDIIAYLICRVHYQMDAIDWPKFWDFAEQHIMPEVTLQ
jgi:phage terminase large subunit GpA-like protein